MLVLSGNLLALFENERSNPHTGETWVEHTCRVLVRATFVDVRLGKNFDRSALPDVGAPVSIEVSVQAYKARNGEARYSFTGWRVASERPSVAVVATAGA